MVPPRGIAPRSAGYQPAALLLSYRGEGNDEVRMPNGKVASDDAVVATARQFRHSDFVIQRSAPSLSMDLHHDLPAYEAGALLLSYRGMSADRSVCFTLKWLSCLESHQDLSP